jgi:hypothetical protein
LRGFNDNNEDHIGIVVIVIVVVVVVVIIVLVVVIIVAFGVFVPDLAGHISLVVVVVIVVVVTVIDDLGDYDNDNILSLSAAVERDEEGYIPYCYFDS